MPLEGAHKKDSTDIRDRSITDADLLRMPITGVTRDVNGNLSQIVRSQAAPDGVVYTVTTSWTRDGTTQAITVETRVYTGHGRTFTETETFTRDGNGLIVSSAIAVT